MFGGGVIERGTLTRNMTGCPRCGGLAQMQDVIKGVRQPFFEEATAALRAATVIDLRRYREFVQEAVAGRSALTVDENTNDLAPIIAAASTWGLPGLAILLAMIQIVLMLRDAGSTSVDHAEMMQALKHNTYVEQQILEEMQHHDAAASKPTGVGQESRQVRRHRHRSAHKNAGRKR